MTLQLSERPSKEMMPYQNKMHLLLDADTSGPNSRPVQSDMMGLLVYFAITDRKSSAVDYNII
jgi:hypothetical protein